MHAMKPFALFLLATLALTAAAIPAAGQETADRDRLVEERSRLLVENAAMRARLSLSKDQAVYLVADLGGQRLRLELQGVTLYSVPIQEVVLNRHAKRVLKGPDRVRLLESPFTLGEDRWFEVSKTLALKDSAAVRSTPDTTGALMQAIRTTPVTAMLHFDRRLTMVLDGQPPRTRWEAWRERAKAWLRSWSAATLEGILRRQSSDDLMVTLILTPSDVRSFAPTLIEGTRLIVIL